jgi:hypothetical protein
MELTELVGKKHLKVIYQIAHPDAEGFGNPDQSVH